MPSYDESIVGGIGTSWAGGSSGSSGKADTPTGDGKSPAGGSSGNADTRYGQYGYNTRQLDRIFQAGRDAREAEAKRLGRALTNVESSDITRRVLRSFGVQQVGDFYYETGNGKIRIASDGSYDQHELDAILGRSLTQGVGETLQSIVAGALDILAGVFKGFPALPLVLVVVGYLYVTRGK